MKVVKKKTGNLCNLNLVAMGSVFELLDRNGGPILRTRTMYTPTNREIVGVYIQTGEYYTVSGVSELNCEVQIISGSFVEE